MRIRVALAFLTLAAGLGACGGSAEGEPVERPEAAVTSPTTATRATQQARGTRGADARRSGATTGCAEKGITRPPFNEGACVENGTRYVIANGRSLMRLRTMSVALDGFSVAQSVPVGGRQVTPQMGAFVFVSLKVENRTGAPQHFEQGQTLLVIEDREYAERTDVERKYARSLAFSGQGPLRPGEVVEGEVIFDVPLEELELVTSRGMLLVENLRGAPSGKQLEIGQFRIYR